ncbi:MAG: O-antigen ligase family protein [Bacteroidales bacterium]|nr:O-antigen ligase family protein [Bacteroidales bacterium]
MSKTKKHKKHKPAPERPASYDRRKRRNKREPGKPLIPLAQIPPALIILAYIVVVTFTPNWMALDTNTTKFLTLSLLNLASFLYLVTNRELRREPGVLLKFFKAPAAMAYAGFLLVVLASFTHAINLQESLLQFFKLFSVFAAVFILAVLLMRDIRLVKMILVVMTALLIFDSVSVFYYINKFIQGDVERISDIKTVYSNKNILASSLYVKLPFALSMLMFDRGRLRQLGWVALFFGMLATFFMATRAFYLGLIVLSLVFLTYTAVHFMRKRERRYAYLAGAYVAALALSLLVFSVVQQNFYPGVRDARSPVPRPGFSELTIATPRLSAPLVFISPEVGSSTGGGTRGAAGGQRHTQSVGEQLASITREDGSMRNRINAWTWSLDLIRRYPLLGVGAGNWKVNILEYENQENPGFIYLYKAHNDFLETTAETGIPGGLLFISIFLLTGWSFIRHYRKKADDPGVLYRALFLSASGLAFYAVDAFFNFPADRPEILLLWSLYLSMGIAATVISKEQGSQEQPEEPGAETIAATAAPAPVKPALAKTLAAVVVVMLTANAYLFYLNYQSSKLQRLVYQDIMAGQLRHTSDEFTGVFPFMPNISIWGESVTSLKARYLLDEGKYRETIEVLINDHGNPWDARREYFLATAYSSLEQYDSALYYSEIAHRLKPYYFRNTHLMMTLLERFERYDEIPAIIDAYLDTDKRTAAAWLYASGFYVRAGDADKAYALITEARRYLRGNSDIAQQYDFVYHHKYIRPNRQLFQAAMDRFDADDFRGAISRLNEYIALVERDPNAYRIRAFSHYRTGRFQESLDDIRRFSELHEIDGALMNLRGVCLRELGDLEGACRAFEQAVRMGSAGAEQNYRNFCTGG